MLPASYIQIRCLAADKILLKLSPLFEKRGTKNILLFMQRLSLEQAQKVAQLNY